MNGITASRPPILFDDVEIVRRSLPDGIIPARSVFEGTFGYLYGEPGLGKTFAMIDLGFQISTRGDWSAQPSSSVAPSSESLLKGRVSSACGCEPGNKTMGSHWIRWPVFEPGSAASI